MKKALFNNINNYVQSNNCVYEIEGNIATVAFKKLQCITPAFVDFVTQIKLSAPHCLSVSKGVFAP